MTKGKESPTVAATTAGHENESNINILPLVEHHLQKLTQEHGLNENTIEGAGLYSANAFTLNQILKRSDIKSDGIVIPYNENYRRVRLTPPQIINEVETKYLSPVGSKNQLFTPKTVIPVLNDSSRILYFTEGEFKALKATQEGFPCIGLAGVWGFKSDGVLLYDFQRIELKDRKIVIVGDSDANFNFNVIKAGYSLALELSKLGAKVRVCILPETIEEVFNIENRA